MKVSGYRKIGLLPMYVALYDELLPDLRHEFADFQNEIVSKLEAQGHAVQQAPICCVANEFSVVIRQFEESGVEQIVTLHLAYSPSLESADALCKTDLPILMLDTSMDADFGIDVAPHKVMYNHGVHGVMDLASVLRRRGRAFDVIAGHHKDLSLKRLLQDTRPVAQAAGLCDNQQPPAKSSYLNGNERAHVAARALRNTRALRIGPVFAGMGDFAVDEEILRSILGIAVSQVDLETLDGAVSAISDDAVANELTRDRDCFDCDLSIKAHARSVRVGLGVRKLLEEGEYDAFSINFQAFDRADRPACTMPFLECSKAMGRGVGYAGEGDVLTAALVGALAQAFDAVTFTEIFCADWAGDSLFLSHMGEISTTVAGETPRVFEKPLPFIGGHSPAVLTCPMRAGPAILVNLTPGPNDSFSLIVAPVEVFPENETLDPAMRDSVRGWIQPTCPVAGFLQAYSRAGGTHHSALVMGEYLTSLEAFGRLIGCEVVTIGSTT